MILYVVLNNHNKVAQGSHTHSHRKILSTSPTYNVMNFFTIKIEAFYFGRKALKTCHIRGGKFYCILIG